MGYRLFVESEDKTLNFYGTKFYGYNFEYASEGRKYASIRYLYELGKISDRTVFDYQYDIEFTLTAEQFAKFIVLYADEYGEDLLQNKEIRALLADDRDKILSWG